MIYSNKINLLDLFDLNELNNLKIWYIINCIKYTFTDRYFWVSKVNIQI